MLIFVPPSETKAFPAGTGPVELGSLALPELAPTRAGLLKGLVRLARGRTPAALEALGLTEGLKGEQPRTRVGARWRRGRGVHRRALRRA
jgi:uncharacterized protein